MRRKIIAGAIALAALFGGIGITAASAGATVNASAPTTHYWELQRVTSQIHSVGIRLNRQGSSGRRTRRRTCPDVLARGCRCT